MTEKWLEFISGGPIAVLIYAAILLIFIVASVKCFAPVSRNTRALRRAARRLIDEGKRGGANIAVFAFNFRLQGLDALPKAFASASCSVTPSRASSRSSMRAAPGVSSAMGRNSDTHQGRRRVMFRLAR